MRKAFFSPTGVLKLPEKPNAPGAPRVSSASPPRTKSGRLVTTLITPDEVFLPNTVPCGPFSTSMRSSSPRSPKPTELRGRYTPSITTPTEDSRPTLSPTVPMPRMRAVVIASLWVLVTVRPGTSVCRSLMSRTPASCMASCDSAVTMIGTSCSTSSRFCAVTTMASRVLASCWDFCAGAACCARAGSEVIAISAVNTATVNCLGCGCLRCMVSPSIEHAGISAAAGRIGHLIRQRNHVGVWRAGSADCLDGKLTHPYAAVSSDRID